MPAHHYDFSDTHSTQRACLNGHIISNRANDGQPQQMWCSKCGQATIDRCPACEGELQGAPHYSSIVPKKPADYCIHCGKALPWTERHLEALREVASLMDELDESDRQSLDDLLPDLVSKDGTPRTEVGIVKMKKLLKKGGSVFAESARKLLVDVISETARKALFPDS
ncbi:MAG TPA: DUF2321 domain-containing protein [Acidobacteriaceae bacterium]|jgi:hypothetical protein|nr:DUF2321 domain-containing protein [Acidobacteriaceae bacterium]